MLSFWKWLWDTKSSGHKSFILATAAQWPDVSPGPAVASDAGPFPTDLDLITTLHPQLLNGLVNKSHIGYKHQTNSYPHPFVPLNWAQSADKTCVSLLWSLHLRVLCHVWMLLWSKHFLTVPFGWGTLESFFLKTISVCMTDYCQGCTAKAMCNGLLWTRADYFSLSWL